MIQFFPEGRHCIMARHRCGVQWAYVTKKIVPLCEALLCVTCYPVVASDNETCTTLFAQLPVKEEWQMPAAEGQI